MYTHMSPEDQTSCKIKVSVAALAKTHMTDHERHLLLVYMYRRSYIGLATVVGHGPDQRETALPAVTTLIA